MPENVITLKRLGREVRKLKLVGMSQDRRSFDVSLSFNRPLTDDEMRFLHSVCERTIPLMTARKARACPGEA